MRVIGDLAVLDRERASMHAECARARIDPIDGSET